MNARKIISDSMFGLLKTKSFEKITVQMILDNCNVSRATFYKYFKDKYELMNWCYQSYVDTLLLNVHEGKDTWKETLYLIFQFLNDNHEYFEKASKVEGKNSFWDFLYTYSYNFYRGIYIKNTQEKSLSTEARITLEFNCMGSVYTVKQWLENGRNESVSEMAELTFQLIPVIYRKYL